MTSIDYGIALAAVTPDSAWTATNVFDYNTFIWQSDDPKPTKKTLDDAWPQVKYDREYAQVQGERRARYAVETDGMFFAAQREGGDLSEWEAAVAAIKADLPYPEPPADVRA